MQMIINKLIVIVFIFLNVPAAHAQTTGDWDTLYDEAVSAYRGGDISKTFQKIDQLLKIAHEGHLDSYSDPHADLRPEDFSKYRKLLELRALALRKAGCPTCALPIYEELITVKKGRAPDSQSNDVKRSAAQVPFPPNPNAGAVNLPGYPISPVSGEKISEFSEELSKAQIELAEELKKKGHVAAEKRFYEGAAEAGPVNGVSAATAHFFLAMSAYRAHDYVEAARSFNLAIASGVPKVIPVSYLYLAKIHFAKKDIYPAIHDLQQAKNIADEQIKSTTSDPETVDTATQIYGAASEMLSKLDVSGYFGTVTVLTGYDSNVLAVPSYTTSVSTTGNDSVTTALSAGYGFSSSPAKEFQYIPSYRFSGNYNLNSSTLGGEFITHDFSVLITHEALNPQTYGVRVEPILTYQDQLSETTNQASFALYSYQIQAAPFFKSPIEDTDFLHWLAGWMFSSELAFSYHHEFGDSSVVPDQRRAGLETTLRLSVTDSARSTYWNPAVGLTVDYNDTSGTEYRDIAVGAELRNVFHVSEKMDVNASAGFTQTSYPLRPEGARSDQLLLLGGSLVNRLTPKWNLLATLQLTKNLSNVPEVYAYEKYALSVGANFNF